VRLGQLFWIHFGNLGLPYDPRYPLSMSKAERASIEVSLRALMALIDGLWREHPILETDMLTDEQEATLHQLDLALRNALSAFDPTKK
jgi:hypothetical protein